SRANQGADRRRSPQLQTVCPEAARIGGLRRRGRRGGRRIRDLCGPRSLPRRRLARRAPARHDRLRGRERARCRTGTTTRCAHLEPNCLRPRHTRPHRACKGIHLEERPDGRFVRRTRQRGGMTALRLLIWVAGGALCAGMALALGPVDQPEIVKHRAVIYFAMSFAALTIGLLVWQRRPGNRIGVLLTEFPLVDILSNGNHIFWNHAIPTTVAFALAYFYVPLFAHLILSYPTGRLATRLDRIFVGLAYLFAALSALPFLLFLDTRAWSHRSGFACDDCANPITHVASYDISGFRDALDWIPLPFAVVFLALLVRKLVRASPGGRRIVLPLSAVAFFAAAQFITRIAVNGTP